MNNTEQIAHIKEIGKAAQGRRQMLKHLEGGRNTKDGAILAFCYMCMGYCADQIVDCETLNCPLYPFHPYNPNRQKMKRTPPAKPKKP